MAMRISHGSRFYEENIKVGNHSAALITGMELCVPLHEMGTRYHRHLRGRPPQRLNLTHKNNHKILSVYRTDKINREGG